jgi:AcrR family transcriptional regulator
LVDRSHTPKGQRARLRILKGAESLFVTHGFHGASMRDIASEADLPLATVVYHFARKEQLYAALLHDIGGELMGELEAALARAQHIEIEVDIENRLGARVGGGRARDIDTRVGGAGAAARDIDIFIAALVRWTLDEPGRVKLLLRELLDNPMRVRRATQLPLAPFLERATAIIEQGRMTGIVSGVGSAELAVLQLVGGVSYVVAAWPTVDRIVGDTRARRLHAAYEREAIAFARRALGIEENHHGSRTPSPARSSRARAPRA